MKKERKENIKKGNLKNEEERVKTIGGGGGGTHRKNKQQQAYWPLRGCL